MKAFKLLLLTALGCLSAHAADQRPFTIADLLRVRTISDPQISPDGRWVAYVCSEVQFAENTSRSAVWLVAIDGTVTRRLTSGIRKDQHPRWSPDGQSIAFESNRGGSFQIWVIPVAGGEARQVTTIATEANQPVWSPDGRSLAFVSAVFPEFSEQPFKDSNALNQQKLEAREQSKVKARVLTQLLYRHWDSWVDDRRQHLFLVPATGGEPRDLTPGDRDAVPTSTTFSAGDEFDFSPDGTELVYTATPFPTREEAWSTNHDLYSVNLRTGVRTQLTTNLAADGLPRFSPDGKYLAYRAQARAGFESDRWQLLLRDRATGQTRSLTANVDSWIENFTWSADSQRLYFEAEDQGNKPLWSVTLAGGDAKRVVTNAVNGEAAVTRDGQTLVFLHQTMSRPPEVYRANANGGDLRPLTTANADLFAPIAMSEPESVWFTGAAGTPVQMWIVKPPGFAATKKYPLVFWVHGGPQGAFMDSWSGRWNQQLWAAQGYVLALPNPRGSTGFGQKFTDEISHDWAGKVYEDLMNGLAYLEQLPYVDTNRMASAGASYGGYMMNWFQGHTDKFKTLVTHCGVYNFYNMYGATEEVWFDEWEHGIPWQTPDFDRVSPHRFAANFKTPNLIIHNELDFRVPINDGLNLFTTLQRKGVPSKLLYFPDEGHWVLKPQNRELWNRTVFDWLAVYLKP